MTNDNKETGRPKGYAGRILRLDLTKRETSYVSTYDYAPAYPGGRAIAGRIFYDEVRPGVKAFDPENKLIFMTGATTATGVPTGGRCVFMGISPNSLPEMYTWSGIGGYFGSSLKFAGYDGIIIEGKAPEHTYVVIDDDKVSFLSAEPMWGQYVHESQAYIFKTHGRDFHSVVIGPAGENLVRNASITTSSDSAAAKAGFGAVFGSKNLKAIAVRGTGKIVPGDIEKMFALRKTLNHPPYSPNPVTHQQKIGGNDLVFEVPGGWTCGHIACSYACTMRCNRLIMDVDDVFTGEKISQNEKCVSTYAHNFKYDDGHKIGNNWGTKLNHPSVGQMLSGTYTQDKSDPEVDKLNEYYPGDETNYWGPSFDRGNLMLQMCNQYGIDKWDVIIWYFTWLSMAKQEGLLEELDFGMEPDVENPEFVRYFLDMVTYRKGKYGDIFAEGMARAMRTLGKEKFADAIYHNRFSRVGGKRTRLDIPVSLESAWGHSSHWSGRGYQPLPKAGWLQTTLGLMVSSRDAQTVEHVHDTIESFERYREDPCHSREMAHSFYVNDIYAEIKDSVTSCEWASHDVFEEDMEAEALSAATGMPFTEADVFAMGVRAKLLFRAILMKHNGRNRDIEVEEVFPYMTYPDPWGETVTWDDWNDLVDLFYEELGWDLKTGWPTRSTWEKYGLEDIADDMEAIGMLPPEGRTEYERKACPFEGHKRVRE